MSKASVEDLKIVPEFAVVPQQQLQWLADAGEVKEMQEGDNVFNIGDPIDKLFIVLNGKIRICTVQSGKLREIVVFNSGDVTGYLPFSRATTAIGFCECLQPSGIFICSAAALKESVHKNYELTEALVHMMTSRVRETTSVQQQNEKMFALGKLSAGLAHELNNPAAAITRAAALLQKQVQQLPDFFKALSALQISAEKIDNIQQLITTKIHNDRTELSMLQKAEREDEISDWLYDNNLPDIDTEGLTEAGFTTGDLNTLKSCSGDNETGIIVKWISNFMVTNKMAEDIRTSSERISELVGAVKNFTFMDKETDKQMIDIHTGIRNTLTMLNYKLKKAGISVHENFDATIPKVKAFPGELNQIWTNLIDNAIDAMEINKNGNLDIRTIHDNRFVKVYIRDDGSGIPDDVKDKIFNPFFTTKEMGKGTGLGLDVVSRIIRQHNGSVKVKSEPGATEFEVCFPMNN